MYPPNTSIVSEPNVAREPSSGGAGGHRCQILCAAIVMRPIELINPPSPAMARLPFRAAEAMRTVMSIAAPKANAREARGSNTERPNENKLSDRHRERVWLQVKLF